MKKIHTRRERERERARERERERARKSEREREIARERERARVTERESESEGESERVYIEGGGKPNTYPFAHMRMMKTNVHLTLTTSNVQLIAPTKQLDPRSHLCLCHLSVVRPTPK